ncbi:hypothetical protein NESM_000370100 [Novymonas esmeraldas]|uniref:Uncharacterized protein n=1 Tax=Novymonas esmeraldas TaxID=1808958 RepID=A0AAW0ELJ0_9TRYP
MNTHPFGLVRPLSSVLHRSLRRFLLDQQSDMPHVVSEGLGTYGSYEQVPHAEMLELLLKTLKSATGRNTTVLTSNGLYFSLYGVRRVFTGVRRFPVTTPEMVKLKRDVELAIVRDIARLSMDDLSSADVGILCGCLSYLTEWDSVEELLRRFPLRETISMQSAEEQRDLVLNVCSADVTSLASAAPGRAAGPVRHATELLHRFQGTERVWQQCRDSLTATSLPLRVAHGGGSGAAPHTTVEARDSHAMACVLYVASLGRWAAATAAAPPPFPMSEAEWVQSVGGGSGGTGGAPPPITLTALSLPLWYRYVAALEQPAIPNFVRASFAAAAAADLLRAYHRGDTDLCYNFFSMWVPALAVATSPLDCRAALRTHHNAVMATLGRGVGADPAASSLSAGAALCVMVAEIHVQEAGLPLPESHVPLMTSLLRTVNQQLRSHCRIEAQRQRDGGQHSTNASGASSQGPSRLWTVARSSHLAVLLSDLQTRFSGGPGRGASSSAAVANLLAEVAQGLELLRPLLSMGLIESRGTARMVTLLLSAGREALLHAGGAAQEAQLQAFALAHVRDGFGRWDVAAIIREMEKQLESSSSSSGADAQKRGLLDGLRAAEQQLPLRQWW